MALYPGTVIRRYPLIYRFAGVSPKPSSPLYNPNGVLASSIPKFGFRASSSFQSLAHSSSSSHGTWFKNLGWLEMKFGHMVFDYFRVSASSDRGVSGIGGGFGGSGDGISGGRGEGAGDGEGGGSKWSLLSWYLSVLEKYPVLTKAITSAILTFIGDLICQLLIDQVSTLDCKRTFLFTFLGFALVGPTLHFWYLCLSKLVTLQGASGALLRLLLDQFIFSPIFIGVFLSTLVTLEGRPSQVVPKLQQEWFSSVLASVLKCGGVAQGIPLPRGVRHSSEHERRNSRAQGGVSLKMQTQLDAYHTQSTRKHVPPVMRDEAPKLR